MKYLLLTLLLMLALHPAGAQIRPYPYQTSVGARLGNTWGLTVNQRVLPRWTVEGILQNDYQLNTPNLTLLMRRHHPIFFQRINWYYGAGLHAGLDRIETAPIAGLDGIVGIETSIARINASADFKPQLDLAGGVRFTPSVAASVRFIVVKAKPSFKFKGSKTKKARSRKPNIRIF
ncbi:MAG: hypothetical protein NW241_13055 [Bacteroidia bacterium]|nr:hypothetical protein [Bacteroidia bacterium]